MNYQEAIEYLYRATPVFQHSGGSAYKPGLSTVIALSEAFGNPHLALCCIHVAGTNGKGSTCHTLAAVLQKAGYKVGLFTSPHLVDFRERIRVNGQKVSEEYVVQFTKESQTLVEKLRPSFFELTTVMAFSHFAKEKVDIAVIEVGMGGRLDSTNIIKPMLSIITGISLDHTQFLGNTIEDIAIEKAGVIKPHVPVVVGEANKCLREIFTQKASTECAPIYFAEDSKHILEAKLSEDQSYISYQTALWGEIQSGLTGDAQPINARTVMTAITLLQQRLQIPTSAIQSGFRNVISLTGLMGRWQVLEHSPLLICDTGHNAGGIAQIVSRLEKLKVTHLHIIFGMAADKDVKQVLELLPKQAYYYFCQASVDRAMPVDELYSLAKGCGLDGEKFVSVEKALASARKKASQEDALFVGGSNFVVADLLSTLHLLKK
ncbi:dihydrofolate synthase [Porphyromonas crevioricanis]|uniref:bifunctional folylpolyglutamate synthase/dihydrofolate synthase n=1 Tax=Porphyromonas crevioricanis TaxID=393921 RepID=UPI00052C8F37|nr:folylpolyglutamate synthase/dihydrofolate synthase family protein [Porphyromonas crevioricanis]KGN88908.1 dihydrofolate synthase [Porphyromonas crevioricanis]